MDGWLFNTHNPLTTGCSVVAAVVSARAFWVALFMDRRRRQYAPIMGVGAWVTAYFAVLRVGGLAGWVSTRTYDVWTRPMLGLVFLGLAAWPYAYVAEVRARTRVEKTQQSRDAPDSGSSGWPTGG